MRETYFPVHFPCSRHASVAHDCTSMEQLHAHLTSRLLLAATGMTRRGALQHAAKKSRSRRIHRDCTLSHSSSSTKSSLPYDYANHYPSPPRTLAIKSPVVPFSMVLPTSFSPASPSSSTMLSSAATSCASNPRPLPLQPPTPKKRPPTPSPSTSAATCSSPRTARCIRPLASPPPTHQLPRRQPQRQRSVFTPQLDPNPLANRPSPISPCGSPTLSTLAPTLMSMRLRSGVMLVLVRIASWATWS